MKEEHKLYPYQNLSIEDMEGEIWSSIKDYPNYMVSNLGRVKSLGRTLIYKTGKTTYHPSRILKQSDNGQGYLIVGLYKNKVLKTYRVNRLVALAFIPNPHNLDEVNHISEVKVDNCVHNLEWVTSKENCNHGSRNWRIGRKNSTILKGRKLPTEVVNKLGKKVAQCNKNGQIIRIWNSASEIKREEGFSISAICSCCRNSYRKNQPNFYKGYLWNYVN